MSSSIKINYILNLINTISGMLFPLITFPYASRVLMAEGIGEINFLNSIISWITLVAAAGIPLYATREIARVKDEGSTLKHKSVEIWLLHMLLSLLAYIAVFTIAFTVDEIKSHIQIFMVLSLSIFFNAFGCEWFYRGREDFKYITIRGIFIRLVYVILLFIFVRKKSDLMAYAWLTVLVTVGNNVFNFFRFNKIVELRRISFKSLRVMSHINGTLKTFALTVSISIYTTLNLIFLGFMSGPEYVGYYVGATRITTVISGLIIALQTTLLPRVSNVLANNNSKEYETLIIKVFNFIFFLCPALVFGLIAVAPILIPIFCGQSFQPAILTLQIVSPVLFIKALSGAASGGILLPHGKENWATLTCIIAAIINIIFNLILIPHFEQNGTAVSSLLTEGTCTILMLFFAKKIIPFPLFNKLWIRYLVAAMLMYLCCIVANLIVCPLAIRLIIMVFIGIIIYLGFLVCVKDRFVIELLTQAINTFNKSK